MAAVTKSEADELRAEHERLLVQMREANERLVLAALRADELVDLANAAREAAADNEERFRSLVTSSAAVVSATAGRRRVRSPSRTCASIGCAGATAPTAGSSRARRRS